MEEIICETGEDTADAGQKLSWEEIKKDPEYNREIQAVVKRRLKAAGQAQEALEVLTPALVSLGLDAENPDYAALAQRLTAKEPREKVDISGHWTSLQAQAEELQKAFPEFSLEMAMEDPQFVRLTAPGGLSVEDAFYALNHRSILKAALAVTARRTAEDLSRSIRSGSHRPRENGTQGQAGGLLAVDYRHATAAQRQALKDQIRAAAARGEKLYPNWE